MTTVNETEIFDRAKQAEMPEPTCEYVRSLMSTYKDYFSTFHAQCRKADEYIANENEIPVPEDEEGNGLGDPVHTGLARSIVKTAADHIDTENMSVEVLTSPRARGRGQRIAKGITGMWLSIKEPALRQAKESVYTYGVGFLKAQFKAEEWPDSPRHDDYDDVQDWSSAFKDWFESRKILFPISDTSPNPRNLIWDDSRSGMRWVIEFYQATGHDLRLQFPQFVGDPSGQFMYWEYWDDEWFGIMAGKEDGSEGQWVEGPYKHGYGRLNYRMIDPVNSVTGDIGEPAKRFVPLFGYSFDLLDAVDRSISDYLLILRKSAYPARIWRNPSREIAEDDAGSFAGWGAENVAQANTTIDMVPQPIPPAQILDVVPMLLRFVERGTHPGIVQGERPAGVSSGFMVSVLAGMGRLSFGPYAEALARAIEGINMVFLDILENKIQTPIVVSARTEARNFDQTIGPKDIAGIRENRVTLRAEAPEERERQTALAIQARGAPNGPIVSRLEAIKRSGSPNPLEELQQIDAEIVADMAFQIAAQQLAQELVAGQEPESAVGQQAAGILADRVNTGQFGPIQPPRPGEAAIQQRRVASRMEGERAYPTQGGLDLLGGRLGGATGGGIRLPSGGRSP